MGEAWRVGTVITGMARHASARLRGRGGVLKQGMGSRRLVPAQRFEAGGVIAVVGVVVRPALGLPGVSW